MAPQTPRNRPPSSRPPAGVWLHRFCEVIFSTVDATPSSLQLLQGVLRKPRNGSETGIEMIESQAKLSLPAYFLVVPPTSWCFVLSADIFGTLHPQRLPWVHPGRSP